MCVEERRNGFCDFKRTAAVKYGELPKKSSHLQVTHCQAGGARSNTRSSTTRSLSTLSNQVSNSRRNSRRSPRAPAQGRVYNHRWAFPKCRLLKLKARRYARAKEHRGSADATSTRPSMVFRLVLYLLTCQCEWYYQP